VDPEGVPICGPIRCELKVVTAKSRYLVDNPTPE
jgi:hypothetical protein